MCVLIYFYLSEDIFDFYTLKMWTGLESQEILGLNLVLGQKFEFVLGSILAEVGHEFRDWGCSLQPF